jgi:hypothetical protein
MLIDKSNDENISSHTEDYYEALAGQEQEYLDEIVEKFRECEVLVFENSSAINITCESPDEPLHQAAEELITGDSDDPPLSDDAVVEILRMIFKA